MKLHLLLPIAALTIAAIACNREVNLNQTPAASPVTQTNQSSADSKSSDPTSLTANWYNYSSAKGKYTAKFPSQPKEETQLIETKAGKTSLFLVSYEDKPNKRAYAISHNAFVTPAGTSFNVEKGLDGSRDGIAQGIGATVTQETKITKNGYQGREVTMTKPDNVSAKARIFYGNGVLYQIFVLVEGQNPNIPEVNAFLDSVEFTK